MYFVCDYYLLTFGIFGHETKFYTVDYQYVACLLLALADRAVGLIFGLFTKQSVKVHVRRAGFGQWVAG